MKLTANLFLCAIGITCIRASLSQSECGKRLESNSVICVLTSEEETIKPFEFNLCTHGVILSPITCENETCTFQTSTVELILNWALPHFPQKLGFIFAVEKPTFEYLNTGARRSNAVRDIINNMRNASLTFITFNKLHDIYNDTHISNFHLFVEKLAKRLHEHDFHIGLDVTITGSELSTMYDLDKMSKVVDWIRFRPSQGFFYGYMQPITPLRSSYRSEIGSTKYWIEKALGLLHPDCLVIDVGPIMQKQKAIEAAVEPGPGSTANITAALAIDLSSVCYQLLIDEKCREYWDDESSTPWAVCGDNYYTYDNAKSLGLKVDLLKRYNVTRLAFWVVDITADNICGDFDPLVLLRAVQGMRQKTL